MTLSEIRRWLKERDIHLTKSLGQNFLHDPHQLDRIVEGAQLTPADRVLEIGPGLGPLTERLVSRAGEVLAVEKDRRLVQVLKERFAVGQASNASASSERAAGVSPAVHTSTGAVVQPEDCLRAEEPRNDLIFRRDAGSTFRETGRTPVLQLVHDDALEWLKRESRDWSDWKVVSNLPYSVGSPILVELCRGSHSPKQMVVTLQLEVVQRLMAGPGGKDFGVLTLLVQLDFEPVQHFRIARACFFPEPDVDSACLVLRRRESPLLPEELRRLFVRVVKRAFSQRRKMMKNLLRAEWPGEKVESAMAAVALDPQVRAEAVSLHQFVSLTRQLAAAALPGAITASTMSEEIFDVVNEHDAVIGRAPRSEVHALGLLHRAVHVLVFNSRGEVFLQKRSMAKDKSPGLWDSSASGHVDSGEDYDACAVRELREEIGLSQAQVPERLFKLPAGKGTDQEHVWVYRCTSDGPFKLNRDEIEEGEWVSPAQVTRRVLDQPDTFAGAFRCLWGRYTELPGA